MIQVTNDVPSQLFEDRKGRTSWLPFDELEVGQGFKVPADFAKPTAVKVAAHRKSGKGKRFSTAKVPDGIWVKRTA